MASATAKSKERNNFSLAEDWHDNERGWLRELRHRYCHFSAHYSSPTVVGHIPRIEGGVRIRQVHRG